VEGLGGVGMTCSGGAMGAGGSAASHAVAAALRRGKDGMEGLRSFTVARLS